jgi:hypothetical protein
VPEWSSPPGDSARCAIHLTHGFASRFEGAARHSSVAIKPSMTSHSGEHLKAKPPIRAQIGVKEAVALVPG